MPNHPLIESVRTARSQGMDNATIIKALTDKGWRIHDVMDIFMEHVTEASTSAFPAPATKTDTIIKVRGITKSYGNFKALDGITLDVARGGVTALLGPNGAGKTTLVRILTTLLAPTSGQATVAGYDVVHNAQALRGAIGLAGQYAAVDEILTGRENLEMVGRLYHLTPVEARARSAELLSQFDLEDAADRPAKTYSGGMRRRLDLAASLVMKPKMLFLDEPTTGLDPRSRFALWNIIRDLVADGTTVLLTTQYLEEADQLARYIFVIDHGHIIAEGTADELKKQVGGDVLELHMEDNHSVADAAQAIAKFGAAVPQPNPSSGTVSMPVAGGASVLVDVVRELDEKGLKIADVILRRPSLDDVFMKLTGHTAENEK